MRIRCLPLLLAASLISSGACDARQDVAAEPRAAGAAKRAPVGGLGDCTARGEQKMLPEDLAAGDIYGAALALDGRLALVASEWDDDHGKDSGAVYAYRCTGDAWQQTQKLHASDARPGDNFGRALSLSGDVAVVGAHFDNDRGKHAGSAYVFRHDGTRWVQEQKLLASDGKARDRFGASVSVHGDLLAVCGWRHDGAGKDAGAVYLFRHDGTRWVQEQKLLASDARPGDEFGRYVSLHDELVLVGAWNAGSAGGRAGAAYVFRHDGEVWREEQKLQASDARPGAATGSTDLGDSGSSAETAAARTADGSFGWVCSVRGEVAVVGDFVDSERGEQAGAVHIYRFDGARWQHELKLTPADAAPHDRFGYATALDGDEGTLLVTAPVALPVVGGPGALYLFRHGEAGWTQEQKLVPSDGAPQDAYGFHAALSGRTILTGSWRRDDAGDDSGAAYFYGLAPR